MTNFAPAISKSEHWLAVELLSFLHSKPAPVAKLVDALDLGSSNASCVGSSPIRRTIKNDIPLIFSGIFLYLFDSSAAGCQFRGVTSMTGLAVSPSERFQVMVTVRRSPGRRLK